ncbi:MAG: Uma2 family endonuclease [Microscillaceae bacterium]|nr:Uma2 family endonuclease [Microscillaceae bacterium]
MTVLDQILDSPQLPDYFRQIQARLREEASKRQEYYQLIKESDKAEFINGEIIYQTPILKRHGNASDNLLVLIKTYADYKDLGYTGHEKYVVSLTRNDYEPDICFWSKEKSQNFTEEQIQFPAPDFIVEVLSKSTEKRDRGIKMEDYALHGVKEYWLVDVTFKQVEQYFLEHDKFRLHRIAKNDDIIESTVIKNFAFEVNAIFDPQINIRALQKLLGN